MSELLNFPIKTAKKLVHTRHFKKPRTAGDIQNALESPPSPIISIPPFPAAVEPPFSNEATSDDDSSDNEDPYDSDSNDGDAEEAGPSSSAPQGSAMDGIREELFVSQLSSLRRIDGSLADAVLAEKSSFEKSSFVLAAMLGLAGHPQLQQSQSILSPAMQPIQRRFRDCTAAPAIYRFTLGLQCWHACPATGMHGILGGLLMLCRCGFTSAYSPC